jgi:putative transposase
VAIREFTAHYHTERNHQSLRNELISRANANAVVGGRVLRRQRPGGVLNFYHREAA